jgi:putative PIG3 family NAD(P)H quinone oxidoreductase
MRCIEIREPGGPEVLELVERPDPVPGPGEVLIGVIAAGVNRPDVLQRRGAYPPPRGASDLPGLEVSGTILDVGDGVPAARIGEAVCALLPGGGYATRCVAAAELSLPVPDGLDIVSAAGLPETCFTVWNNVFERGRLAAGETALFHGGSSGIGTTAIQMAAARGARAIVTAGSDEKCQACLELGAFAAINYRSRDFVEEVRRLTDGRGVDLILDIVGGSYVPRNLTALAVEGRLVQIGLMEGPPEASVDFRKVLGRRLTLTGSTLRPRSVPEKAAIARAVTAEVWPMVSDGRVRPVVHRTFPLAEAAAAHRVMETSEHIGKILLTTR